MTAQRNYQANTKVIATSYAARYALFQPNVMDRLDLYRPERCFQNPARAADQRQQLSRNVNTNGFRADMAMAINDKVKGGWGASTTLAYMAQEGGQRRECFNTRVLRSKNRTPAGWRFRARVIIAARIKTATKSITATAMRPLWTTRQLDHRRQSGAGDNGPTSILPPSAIASFAATRRSVTPDDGDVTATMDNDRLKLADIPGLTRKNAEGMLVTADGFPLQRDENIKVSGGFLKAATSQRQRDGMARPSPRTASSNAT